MIPSLEDVLAFTTKVPGYYSEQEIAKLYEYVAELPEHARITELGVQHGRSASVYFQIAQHKPLHITLVDNWSESGLEARLNFNELAVKFNVPFVMFNMSTAAAAMYFWYPMRIDVELLHVDAGHDEGSIWSDCSWWLSRLVQGGRVLFHDYDRKAPDGITEVFPGIKRTVDFWCRGWEDLGVHDTLAVRRKL